MADSMRSTATVRQPDSLDRVGATRTTAVAQASVTGDVELMLVFIRQAMNETGWSPEALSSHMGYQDASYVGKVLKGEKPLSARFIVALPEAVEALFSRRYAENCGHVVVAPVHGDDAIRNLVSGLIGVLSHALPARASQMAKASMAVDGGSDRKVAQR